VDPPRVLPARKRNAKESVFEEVPGKLAGQPGHGQHRTVRPGFNTHDRARHADQQDPVQTRRGVQGQVSRQHPAGISRRRPVLAWQQDPRPGPLLLQDQDPLPKQALGDPLGLVGGRCEDAGHRHRHARFPSPDLGGSHGQTTQHGEAGAAQGLNPQVHDPWGQLFKAERGGIFRVSPGQMSKFGAFRRL